MPERVYKPVEDTMSFMDCFTYQCSAAQLTGDQLSHLLNAHRTHCTGYTAEGLLQSKNKYIPCYCDRCSYFSPLTNMDVAINRQKVYLKFTQVYNATSTYRIS